MIWNAVQWAMNAQARRPAGRLESLKITQNCSKDALIKGWVGKHMTTRRRFIAGAGAAAAAALTSCVIPAQPRIKWRLQTYASPNLAAHVI